MASKSFRKHLTAQQASTLFAACRLPLAAERAPAARSAVLPNSRDNPRLIVAIGAFQRPAFIEPLACVFGAVSVQAIEADGYQCASVGLADAVQTRGQLVDEAIGGWRRFLACGQQLLQQLGAQVLGHAGAVAVTPVALQGIEMLLGTTQEYLGVEPGRGVNRRSGSGLCGMRWLPVLHRLALHGRSAGRLPLRLALLRGLRAAAEQLEQNKGDQAEQQNVEQLNALEAVTEQHGR